MSLLTIGFYLGWTDGDSVTLMAAALFLPYVLLAPLVILPSVDIAPSVRFLLCELYHLGPHLC